MRVLAVFFLAISIGVCGAQVTKGAGGVDEIVVTGEQPGPKLWKLTKHGHTLWILATVNPKPRDIIWTSVEVAEVLDDTQEVFNQANIIDFDVKGANPLTRLRAYRKAVALANQSKKQLPVREAVPSEDYARFSKLKAIYLPKSDDLDRAPPLQAAETLYNAAIDAKGMTHRAQIHDKVHWLARLRNVKVKDVKTEFKFDVETFINVQLEILQNPKEAELNCFRETLDQIETGLPHLTARANAWAKGDVERLKTLDVALQRPSCARGLENAPRWADINNEADANWVRTMESTVLKNKSTLVMLDIAELIRPDGLVQQLGKSGFEIEGPQ
jgi:uncharacterized protein YbaP (TraB family)